MPTGMPVKWRLVLTVLLALLLIAPLMGLLLVAIHGGQLAGTRDSRIVPMLARDQRRGLLTYERACQQREECEPPLSCFMDPMNGVRYCTDSQCMTDEDCQTGFACRTFLSADDVSRVRLCSPLGLRKEGEPCEPIPNNQERGCQQGLLCQDGWCGRPCQLNDPAPCPEDFFCQEGADGPSCLPTCEDHACPEGRECIALGERVSVCAKVHGQNCHRTPCLEGNRCLFEGVSNRTDEVWMSCVPPCGGDDPPCPEGLICHNYRCRQPCDPNGPDVCGPDRRCARRTETQPWTCRPAL
jgi:hypothetical protein